MKLNTFTLAYKNLKRKKTRTILTISGVAIAVAVLISLVGFKIGYKKALTQNIEQLGYHVLITAKGCPYEAATLMLKGGGSLRYIPQKIYEKIKKDKRVALITPQLIHTVYSEEKEGMSMFMGIERSYLKLKPWCKFHEGGWFSSDNADEVILGYEVAEFEQRLVGDMYYIPRKEKILKVVGIFERTGTQDDGIIFLPLKTCQRIFNIGNRLTGIGVKLKEIEKIKEFEESYYDVVGIQIISMSKVKGTILNLISSARVLLTSVALIAVFVAVIGVLNTILMSVFERTQEIGVMKAIGASKTDIFKIIFAETALICFFGGVLGSIIAVLGSGIVEFFIKKFLPYTPIGKLVLITPSLLIVSIIGAVILGLFSGFYPALRASLMSPVEAIRSGE
jgi:putative ABC transport system permease protein